MKALIQLKTLQNEAIEKAFYALGEVPDTGPEKIDYVALLSEEFEKQIKDLKQEIAKIQLKKKEAERAQEYLDMFIKSGMSQEGIAEEQGKNFKFILSDSQGSLLIEKEDSIPEEFFEEKIERVLNKERLKAALTLGMVIDGVSIKKGHRLLIKARGE